MKQRNPDMCRLFHDNGLIAVEQGIRNGHPVSFNPDDNRYYVHNLDGSTRATFAEWGNTTVFVRSHTPK